MPPRFAQQVGSKAGIYLKPGDMTICLYQPLQIKVLSPHAGPDRFLYLSIVILGGLQEKCIGYRCGAPCFS